MRIVIAGPCGVGKSTISRLLAENARVAYVDFDEIGVVDMKRRRGQVSPFSAGKLNLKECIPSVLDPHTTGFILDLGGDTVFRRNADNDNRLEQMIWVKQKYNASIVAIIAHKTELRRRFLTSKNRRPEEFEDIWRNWKNIGEYYWRKCADTVIDATGLTLDDWRRLPDGFPRQPT